MIEPVRNHRVSFETARELGFVHHVRPGYPEPQEITPPSAAPHWAIVFKRKISLQPSERKTIKTGWVVEVPQGYVLWLRPAYYHPFSAIKSQSIFPGEGPVEVKIRLRAHDIHTIIHKNKIHVHAFLLLNPTN